MFTHAHSDSDYIANGHCYSNSVIYADSYSDDNTQRYANIHSHGYDYTYRYTLSDSYGYGQTNTDCAS